MQRVKHTSSVTSIACNKNFDNDFYLLSFLTPYLVAFLLVFGAFQAGAAGYPHNYAPPPVQPPTTVPPAGLGGITTGGYTITSVGGYVGIPHNIGNGSGGSSSSGSSSSSGNSSAQTISEICGNVPIEKCLLEIESKCKLDVVNSSTETIYHTWVRKNNSHQPQPFNNSWTYHPHKLPKSNQYGINPEQEPKEIISAFVTKYLGDCEYEKNVKPVDVTYKNNTSLAATKLTCTFAGNAPGALATCQ